MKGLDEGVQNPFLSTVRSIGPWYEQTVIIGGPLSFRAAEATKCSDHVDQAMADANNGSIEGTRVVPRMRRYGCFFFMPCSSVGRLDRLDIQITASVTVG